MMGCGGKTASDYVLVWEESKNWVQIWGVIASHCLIFRHNRQFKVIIVTLYCQVSHFSTSTITTFPLQHITLPICHFLFPTSAHRPRHSTSPPPQPIVPTSAHRPTPEQSSHSSTSTYHQFDFPAPAHRSLSSQ